MADAQQDHPFKLALCIDAPFLIYSHVAQQRCGIVSNQLTVHSYCTRRMGPAACGDVQRVATASCSG